MGNRKSHRVKVETGRPVPFTRAWDLVFSGNIQAWKTGAAEKFGMEGDMFSGHYLDHAREECLEVLKESFYKASQFLEMESDSKPVILVLERWSQFATLVEEDHLLNPAAQAKSRDIAVLHFIDLKKMVSDPDFPLLHLSSPHISISHQFCPSNIAAISCTLTPDFSMTAVLFRISIWDEHTLNYDLHLFSNNSGELVKSVSLNRNIQPYFSFDPRYSWSGLAVVNYENREDNVRHDLVVLSLDSEKILQQSVCSLLATNNRKFCMQHSRDGALLILQKFTQGRYRRFTCSDIFIFHSSQLQLIKHITTTMAIRYHYDRVNYEAMFSKCGSYMRVPIHLETVKGPCAWVNVYQLPRQLNLRSQCRIVILQHLPHSNLVDSLPLPSALKDYLLFKPFL